jgi:hypothetical protein
LAQSVRILRTVRSKSSCHAMYLLKPTLGFFLGFPAWPGTEFSAIPSLSAFLYVPFSVTAASGFGMIRLRHWLSFAAPRFEPGLEPTKRKGTKLNHQIESKPRARRFGLGVKFGHDQGGRKAKAGERLAEFAAGPSSSVSSKRLRALK